MTGLPDVGPWVALAVALAGFGLFGAHVLDARRAYARYHDDRAALDLLGALTLTGSTLGLVVAASAPFAETLGVTRHDDLLHFGIGITAGALLVTSMTMWAIDRDLTRMRR